MSDTNPLTPLLEDAEAELTRRLREACEAEERGVSTDSTQEIRRLEDTLLAAAGAAEQAIRVRRHMRRQEQKERPDSPRQAVADRPLSTLRARPERPAQTPPTGEPPREPGSVTASEMEAVEAPSTVVREFTDSTGRSWRAWPVTPRKQVGVGSRRFLGSFQDGWICFEALDSSARRRLPRHHPEWAELKEEELEGLLRQAIAAPPRAKH